MPCNPAGKLLVLVCLPSRCKLLSAEHTGSDRHLRAGCCRFVSTVRLRTPPGLLCHMVCLYAWHVLVFTEA